MVSGDCPGTSWMFINSSRQPKPATKEQGTLTAAVCKVKLVKQHYEATLQPQLKSAPTSVRRQPEGSGTVEFMLDAATIEAAV